MPRGVRVEGAAVTYPDILAARRALRSHPDGAVVRAINQATPRDGETTCALLAVDPARRSGWARFEDGRLNAWGVLSASAAVGIDLLMAGVHTLAIEVHTHPRSQRTAVSLAESRMVWETCARLRNATVERVNSQTWQGALGIGGTSERRKRLAQALALNAARHAGHVVREIPKDAADAVCIGLWWIRREWRKGR